MVLKKFGKGFKMSPPKTKKKISTPIKIKKLKTRKQKKLIATESQKTAILSKVCENLNLPQDIEQKIIEQSRGKIHPKLKKEIILYNELSNVLCIKNMRTVQKKNMLKFFKMLNVNHKKGFILVLQKDLDNIHPKLFKWLILNWNDSVLFIGNRKIPNENVTHFFNITYNSTNIPKKVNIRKFILEVNNYLITFDN